MNTSGDCAQLARDAFVRTALADPFEGQLLRAAEALSDVLQRGQTWDGYEERLAELETLAISRTAELLATGDREGAARALMTMLREQGFEGNRDHYEAVENSFIDRVLQTGRGLPITLSVVAIHLAELAGVNLRGIGFPGHFIVGADLDSPTPSIFDPFEGGTVLSFHDLAELYHHATGRHLTAHAPMLRDALKPTGTRAILIRMGNNLHHHYARRGSHDRVAEVVGLLAALHPQGDRLRKLAGKLSRRVETLN